MPSLPSKLARLGRDFRHPTATSQRSRPPRALPSPHATPPHSMPPALRSSTPGEQSADDLPQATRVGPGKPAETALAANRQHGLLTGRPPPLQDADPWVQPMARSEEHTSELQSLMRISYAVFCLKNKKNHTKNTRSRLELDITTTHKNN